MDEIKLSITEQTIASSIIDQINSLDQNWTIVAYNNDVTPFQIVFLVLKAVVPMTDEQAYKTTEKIHFEGSAVIYKGSKEHCHKIGDALDKIKVEYKIS